jgi:tRNA nucleotidyltransferase (CCA-adding enzyme)
MNPGTLALINPESLAVLKTMSGERLRHELDLIFEEQEYPAIFARLENLEVLTAIEAPGFNKLYASLSDNLPDAALSLSCDRVMLGYLLWLTDSDSTVINRLSNRLRFASELTETLVSASRLRQRLPGIQHSKASEWTFELEELPPASVYGVYLITNQKELLAFLAAWRQVKPAATGDDLKARGLEPGPRYGEILRRLRAARLDGEVKSDMEEKSLLDKLLK